MGGKLSPSKERQAMYTTLTGLFMTVFAGFSLYQTRQRDKVKLSPMEFLQLALATFRLGRLISYDKVFEPYRAPFTRTVPDPSGEGMTVVPKGKGARQAVGDLVACPICAGTWVAAILVYGMGVFPNVTRAFVAIMSTIGAAELLDAATEALQWTGQLAREKAGTERAKHGQSEETPRDTFGGPRFPAHLGTEIPRRRSEDREWKRPQQPVQ